MARISEIHYSDVHAEQIGIEEFMEVALAPGENPEDYVFSLYNSDGSVFISLALTHAWFTSTYDPDTGETAYVLSSSKLSYVDGADEASASITEAVALTNISGATNEVIDFYDWGEGTQNIVATDGPAAGATSVNLDTPSSDKASIQFNQPDAETPIFAFANPGDTGDSGFVCFVADTLIDTPDGPKPVQDLNAGDLVMTREDGPQPLIWTGSRTVRGDGKYAPYRIAAGTLNADADVYLSPAHRVLYTGAQAELLFGEDEVLVPVNMLANDKNIVRDPRPEVTYCHIMCANHQIVFSHGMASESFFPGAFAMDSLETACRDEIFDLFPELRSDMGSYGSTCRPVVKSKVARLLSVAGSGH